MGQDIINKESLLTKKQVAELYKCSTKTIESRVKIGMLKAHKFGPRMVRFKESELPILSKNK